MSKRNIRYIVAYLNPKKDSSSDFCTDKPIYWYEWEAEKAAKVIGGWVIHVDLTPKKVED